MVQYALDVQLHINISWDREMSQPEWQPWTSLTTLFSDQEAIPGAHRALLLQLVLASPHPLEVRNKLSHACAPKRSGITLADTHPQRHAWVRAK